MPHFGFLHRRLAAKVWRGLDYVFWFPLGTHGEAGMRLLDLIKENDRFAKRYVHEHGRPMPVSRVARCIRDDLFVTAHTLRLVGGAPLPVYRVSDPFMMFVVLPGFFLLAGFYVGGRPGMFVAGVAAGWIWRTLFQRLRLRAGEVGGLTDIDSGKLLTLPNLLSGARLLTTPLFPVVFAVNGAVPAAVLLAALATTDWADGFVARHYQLRTRFGTMLDPTVDRLLAIIVIATAYQHGLMWPYLAAAHLLRELLIFVFGLTLFRPRSRDEIPRIKVHWSGKLGFTVTMCAMVALLATSDGWAGFALLSQLALCGGLVFNAWALGEYLKQAAQRGPTPSPLLAAADG